MFTTSTPPLRMILIMFLYTEKSEREVCPFLSYEKIIPFSEQTISYTLSKSNAIVTLDLKEDFLILQSLFEDYATVN